MQTAEEAIPNPKSDTRKFPEEAIPNPRRDTPYLISAPEPLNVAARSFQCTVCRGFVVLRGVEKPVGQNSASKGCNRSVILRGLCQAYDDESFAWAYSDM